MNSNRFVRFERSADAAFRTARYAAAIERPMPPLWKRLVISLWRWC